MSERLLVVLKNDPQNREEVFQQSQSLVMQTQHDPIFSRQTLKAFW